MRISMNAATGISFFICTAAYCAPGSLTEATHTLPKRGEALVISARCGRVGGEFRLVASSAGKRPVTLSIKCEDMPTLNHHWGLTKVARPLPDAALVLRMTGDHGWDVPRIQRAYFIRPDVHFYSGEEFKQAVERWDQLAPASGHTFRLELARRDGRIEISVDGRYFASFTIDGGESLRLSTQDGAEVVSAQVRPARESDLYLLLDLHPNPAADQKEFTSLSLRPGRQSVATIPMEVLPPSETIDVGRSRWLQEEGGWSAFYDAYYKRTAWDGVPETVMFSVPRRFYNYAHILCAVETGGSESPSMSLRLARYRQAWDGSGGTQADSTVVIDPRSPVGCGAVRRVGSAKVRREGRTESLPLYLISVPLHAGQLADCLRRKTTRDKEAPDFFYLELTRQLRLYVSGSYGHFDYKPLGPPSGVHVFAITLEKSPVEILVGSDAIGNVFTLERDPRLLIDAWNPSTQTIVLNMETTLTDFWGAERGTRQTVTFPPGKTVLPYPLDGLASGWRRARFAFSFRDRVVWEQSVDLALLPPDTRRAGPESPFGIWWFAGPHYCESDPNRVLPLVEKMGFRHVTAEDRNPQKGHTPEVWGRYQVTPSMMRRIKERPNGPSVQEQASRFLHDWPGTRFAMIFHETGGLPFGLGPPPELLGLPAPKLSGDDLAKEKELLAHIRRHAIAIRKADPNTRILLGNSSTNFNVHWLRKRLPREQWDYIGMEMAVQLFPPESQPHGWNLQALWIAKRMCQLYGYDDIPIASCYEFDYRATAPGALSLRTQANWYVRDALHCLAYGLPTINIGLIHDVDSAYYFSRWGSTGVCGRAPWMMPKPSFVALATLTRVLDGAHYQHWLDTGSHSLYCLEFQREGGFVYALWTTTGRRDVELTLPEDDGSCVVVDVMGRESKPKRTGRELLMRVSESPSYLLTSHPLNRVRAGQPHHRSPDMPGLRVIDPLRASEWQLAKQDDPKFRRFCPYKPQVPADCSLSSGADGHVRLSLHPQPEVPDILARYVILEPKSGPIPIDAGATAIGAWVNGNSNWGRLIFQVRDADDTTYTSVSFGSWDVSDWEATTSINFDGWKFVQVGFPRDYESGSHGPNNHHWSPPTEPKRPLKLTRLYLILRQRQVYVTDMVPASSRPIELRHLTAELARSQSAGPNAS